MNTRKLFQLLFNTTRTRVAVIPNARYIKPTAATRYFSTSLAWRSSMLHDKKCWQCQATNKPSALFCENKVCNVIQPIPSQLNFFRLLQAGEGEERDKPTFDIDLKAMKRRFLMLQQKAHPDSFSNGSKRELNYAQLQSSVINRAYHTLKNPLSRAQYILKQQGVEVNEDDSLSDPELLMEVMEFREELEEVENEKDIVPLKERNDGKHQEIIQKLKDAFDKEDYSLAKDLAIELQYWTSIQNAILEWHP
ncbi:MAG: Co-chaperone HscB, C-terminal oligomerization domain-containing protein [Benjaminiella poitrasii]|nr:MAG: Co-chaperone HscB, C-terminal oligomerization domain-containing protein [Benjaminiella poitrasii]